MRVYYFCIPCKGSKPLTGMEQAHMRNRTRIFMLKDVHGCMIKL